MENPILRRTDEMAVLQRMYPVYLKSCKAYYDLAMHCSLPEWKDRLVLFWQRQLGCVTDLEEKIRSRGGILEDPSSMDRTSDEKFPLDPIKQDQWRLMRVLDLQIQLLQMYMELQKTPRAVDMAMLLRRHQLQGQNTVVQLRSLYSAHPPTSPSAVSSAA